MYHEGELGIKTDLLVVQSSSEILGWEFVQTFQRRLTQKLMACEMMSVAHWVKMHLMTMNSSSLQCSNCSDRSWSLVRLTWKTAKCQLIFMPQIRTLWGINWIYVEPGGRACEPMSLDGYMQLVCWILFCPEGWDEWLLMWQNNIQFYNESI